MALYFASRYQRGTANDLSANHGQVLAQFAALTTLFGEAISELVAQTIGEQASSLDATVASYKPEAVAAVARNTLRMGVGKPRRGGPRVSWSEDLVQSAYVTGGDRSELVLQSRSHGATHMKVVGFDDNFRPRLLAVLQTDARAKYGVNSESPAKLRTLDNIGSAEADLVTYEWHGGRMIESDRQRATLTDAPAASLLWESRAHAEEASESARP